MPFKQTKIIKLTANWFFTTDLGEECTVYEVGVNGVLYINPAPNEKDIFEITYEDKIITVRNPNLTVESLTDFNLLKSEI